MDTQTDLNHFIFVMYWLVCLFGIYVLKHFRKLRQLLSSAYNRTQIICPGLDPNNLTL